MPEQKLTVLIFAFQTEAASVQAFNATMRLIAGGSAYRIIRPGVQPFILVVFAIDNAPGIERAIRAAGGTPATIAADMLANLAERSAQAAQRGIVGQRHHAAGTKATDNLPTNQDDYQAKE